jgi:tetratricopeptide (TPR) repeat protein
LKGAPLAVQIAALASALTLTSVARADPSIWQRAAQPELARNQVLLTQIERELSVVGVPELNEGAVAMFQLSEVHWRCAPGDSEVAGSAESTPALDPRIEFLIGEALLDAENERNADGRCILERALRDAPDSPLAADGYANLALACGRLGDHKAERAAYLNALEISWDPDERARLYAGLAESDMGARDLKKAVREYRLAVDAAQQADTVSLAYYGLAVALDRSGDLPSALDAAKHAIWVQLPGSLLSATSVLDLPNVSFSPSYEIHYYKALGAMATALLVKDDAARREAFADAVEHWTAYLVPAEVEHTPWAQPARLHKASVERELSKLPLPRAKPPELPPTL